MTPHATDFLAPLQGRFTESVGFDHNTGLNPAKRKNVLAHSPVHSAANSNQ
jgi:hypothetical protein